MTGLESCRITAPSPFLEASVCRVVALFGLKYGRVTFLDIASFVLEKATCVTVHGPSASACGLQDLGELHSLTERDSSFPCSTPGVVPSVPMCIQ